MTVGDLVKELERLPQKYEVVLFHKPPSAKYPYVPFRRECIQFDGDRVVIYV